MCRVYDCNYSQHVWVAMVMLYAPPSVTVMLATFSNLFRFFTLFHLKLNTKFPGQILFHTIYYRYLYFLGTKMKWYIEKKRKEIEIEMSKYTQKHLVAHPFHSRLINWINLICTFTSAYCIRILYAVDIIVTIGPLDLIKFTFC